MQFLINKAFSHLSWRQVLGFQSSSGNHLFTNNVPEMSAYAAGMPSDNKKSNNRNKRTKHNKLQRSQSLDDSESVSGLNIRRTAKYFAVLWLESYITVVSSFLVVVYVYGRRLVTKRSLTDSENRGNPYSSNYDDGGGIKKIGDVKEVDTVGCFSGGQEENKVKPPSCLEDPRLGVHKFIKIQGVKLHYVEAGSGKGHPTLLLLHGVFDFWFTWRKLIPALARRFRVICLDLRGCGDSEKPLLRGSYSLPLVAGDVAAFIRTLGDPAHDGSGGGVSLISTGWGGQIAWWLAEHHPGLVRKMVQVHAPHPHVIRSYSTGSITSYYKLWPLLFARLPSVPEWAAGEGNLGLLSKMMQPLVDQKEITDGELDAYYYNFSRAEDITGALHHVRNWDFWGQNIKVGPPSILTTPTLLLMGDADPHIPLEAGYKSAEYVERIKTRVLVGAGHWAVVTHSTAILEELALFFGEPRILDDRYCSSENEWDNKDDEDQSSDDEGAVTGNKGSMVGRMVGAGLSVVSKKWGGN